MTEPVIGLYAYGEMELGRADDRPAAAQPRDTDKVDAEDKDE